MQTKPTFAIPFLFLLLLLQACSSSPEPQSTLAPASFPGDRAAGLDTLALAGSWEEREGFLAEVVKAPRDSVVAFALYTHDRGVLKMTTQLHPLRAEEAMEVRLELQRNGEWEEVATALVQ